MQHPCVRYSCLLACVLVVVVVVVDLSWQRLMDVWEEVVRLEGSQQSCQELDQLCLLVEPARERGREREHHDNTGMITTEVCLLCNRGLTSHHPSLSVFLFTISTISPTLIVSSSVLSASYSNVTLAFSAGLVDDD